MGKLFFNMGVFAFVVFLTYLACLMFIRIEERRQEERKRRGS